MKKYKKLKKLLDKELSRFDTRIYDIEVNLGMKTIEVDPAKFPSECLKQIQINDAQHLKPSFEVDFSNVKTELQVGKWYRTDHAIVCYEGLPDIEQAYPSFKGYGIIEGDWIGKESEEDSYNGWTIGSEWVEATQEEVESALIKEAERRGFKEGVKVKALLVEHTFEFNDSPIKVTNEQGDTFAIRGGGICIYHNGKWAEIVEPSAKEIDWNAPSKLYSNEENMLVVSTGWCNDEYFDALILKNIEGNPESIVRKLQKNLWQPFNGSYCLKN